MFLSKKFFCPFQKGLYIRPRAVAIERIGLIFDDSLNPTFGRGVIFGKDWTDLVTDAISPAGIGRIWSQTPFPRRELDVFSHRRHFLGGNWTYLVTDAISSAGMRYIRVNDKHFYHYVYPLGRHLLKPGKERKRGIYCIARAARDGRLRLMLPHPHQGLDHVRELPQ